MWVCKKCQSTERYKFGDCAPCARERSVKWRNANLEKAKEADHKKYLKNKDTVKVRTKAWAEQNPEKCKLYRKEARQRNLPKFQARASDYRKRNPDKVKAQIQKWFDANPGIRNAYLAKRRSQKLKATPSWLTEAQHLEMLEFYVHAKDCELVSGETYHVDHIVPLQGKGVCGLHVPWNLQILPSDLNIRKNNKLESSW
jgi:hypothetical protein